MSKPALLPALLARWLIGLLVYWLVDLHLPDERRVRPLTAVAATNCCEDTRSSNLKSRIRTSNLKYPTSNLHVSPKLSNLTPQTSKLKTSNIQLRISKPRTSHTTLYRNILNNFDSKLVCKRSLYWETRAVSRDCWDCGLAGLDYQPVPKYNDILYLILMYKS